jgi:hypothetical protein
LRTKSAPITKKKKPPTFLSVASYLAPRPGLEPGTHELTVSCPLYKKKGLRFLRVLYFFGGPSVSRTQYQRIMSPDYLQKTGLKVEEF